ncbi:ATP-binding protein [Calderihabitans maritimus]|uniref:histidine kinase n=1 Tax=Calderihabitans maritimus TaxID=1246530 RepID=A0A1Z5HUD3_9FIRM|nr:ATP-binding protein [Calderihabitans maritimus]GAW93018.1 multi-sensor signal transduction histidine kinase [Calderihabitans maritimus]
MRGIIGKLWLTNVFLVVLTLLILGIALGKLFENFYFSQRAEQLIRDGRQIAQLVVERQTQDWTLEEINLLSRFIDSNVMVVDRKGLVRACGGMMRMRPGMHLEQEEINHVLEGKTVISRGFHPRFDMPVLSVAVPIRAAGEVVGAVLLHTPVEPITQSINAIRRLILYAAAGAVLVATIISFFLSRQLSLPLLEMKRVALNMARGDFRGRIKIRAKDEIGTLGETLNFLSAKLEKNLRALSQEKEKLANILSSMTDGVITFDAEGKVILTNPVAEQLLDIKQENKEQLEKKYPEINAVLHRVLETNVSEETQIKVGEKIIALRMAPLRQEDGEIYGVVALLQDVTKEWQLERLRRDFVASVSHELRTPLTYLQGYAEAILDGLAETPQQQRKYLEIILEETLRLRRLVSELLDLSQLESGQINLNFSTFSLPQLVRRVTDKLKPVAEKQGIILKTDLPSDLPLVFSDEDRVEQVLINLLDNALQHTPTQGEITIKAEVLPEEIKISVADTGPGIPREELPLIWERFYKVDKARTRAGKGTGLGLAIVKNIVTALGGEVGVESEVGKGSVFSFTLPLRDPEQDK